MIGRWEVCDHVYSGPLLLQYGIGHSRDVMHPFNDFRFRVVSSQSAHQGLYSHGTLQLPVTIGRAHSVQRHGGKSSFGFRSGRSRSCHL